MSGGPFDVQGNAESPAMKRVREQSEKGAKETERQRARHESAVAHRLSQNAKRELESSSEPPPLKAGFMEHVYEAAYRLSGGFGLLFLIGGILLMFVGKAPAEQITGSFQYGVYSLMVSALFKIVATLTAIHRLLLGQCR